MSYSPIISQQYLTELSSSNRKAFTKQPMDSSLNFFYDHWKKYCNQSTPEERKMFFKENYKPGCALDHLVAFALNQPSNKIIVDVKNLMETALGRETVPTEDVGIFQVVNPLRAHIQRGDTPSPTPSSVSASPSPASPPTIAPPAAPPLPPPPELSF